MTFKVCLNNNFFAIGNLVASANGIHYELGKDYGPHQAINGDTGISWGNLCVIVGALSPWFQLDMAESYCIHSVKVFDRAFGDGGGKFLYTNDYLMLN